MDSTLLFKEIEETRECGAVYLAMHERPENTDWEAVVLENFVITTISLEKLSVSLVQIDKAKAQSILALLLYKDMAYESEIMPIDRADYLVERFCDLFTNKASYFSNSTRNKNDYFNTGKAFELGLNSWNPLTEATFDSGIIVCDDERIGVAWFEDED